MTLRLELRPEDQGSAIASDSRRSAPLGIATALCLLRGLLLAVAALVWLRLADWGLRRLGERLPPWRLPDAGELQLMGGILAATLLLALWHQLRLRTALRRMLAAQPEPAREPLLGRMTVTLGPGQLTSRSAAEDPAQGWDWTVSADRLIGLEETPELLLLRFGPQANTVPLPRRDLSAADLAAVRAWVQAHRPAAG